MLIYVIVNQITKKLYVGQTVQTLVQRKHAHKSELKKFASKQISYQSRLYPSMEKYGFEIFTFMILENNVNCQSDLDLAERWWVSYLNTTDPEFGYNIQTGGYGRGKHTPESKLKISKSKLGNKHPRFGQHLPQDYKEKISSSLKGDKSPMYGQHLSQKTKDKISESMKVNAKRGEKHYKSKLTWEIVEQIRKEYTIPGTTKTKLAKKYGLHVSSISDIINYVSWKSCAGL